jgi:hypothetical protein
MSAGYLSRRRQLAAKAEACKLLANPYSEKGKIYEKWNNLA